jgi:dTMP kinase
LVVFEGLDGCGKSTQARMLVGHLLEGGKKARLVHFPAYRSETGKMIAEHLRGENSYGPWETALLYALDKYAQAPLINRLLSDGVTVVVDRYTASNCAYQSARIGDEDRRLNFIKWVLVVEMGLPRPDAEIFLDADPSVSFRKNLSKKGRAYLGTKKDVYEKDLNFQREVRRQYLEVAKITGMKIIKASHGGSMLPEETVGKTVERALPTGFFSKQK